MQNTFEQIGAREYTELYDRYTPLTAAVRDLVDISMRTDVDSDIIANATTAIEAVTDWETLAANVDEAEALTRPESFDALDEAIRIIRASEGRRDATGG